MSIHYKFKSTLNFDTITFDGLHISVGDLRKEIVHQKRLGKITDFDLQITNAQTKEEYADDAVLIPKNTTLIISRVPVMRQQKKGWEMHNDSLPVANSSQKPEKINLDLSKMKGSEEDKINAMMIQSTADYDPKTYQRIRGQSQFGEVPATYRCNKCKKGGHWIKNCPFGIGKEHMEVKRSTGIPRSFRDNQEMVQAIETKEPLVMEKQKQEIPEDLLCGLCNDLFLDAVMIPCCGSSFCDDCVRTALLESDDNECPDCKEKGCSPGSLIPNRFLRNSVNVFKNETGYKAVHVKNDTAIESPNVVEKEKEKVDNSPPSDTSETVSNKIEEATVETVPVAEKVIPVAPIKIDDDSAKPDSVLSANNTENELIESDEEDNITITMPEKLLKQKEASVEKELKESDTKSLQPPGTDSLQRNAKESPKHVSHEKPEKSAPKKPIETENSHEQRSTKMNENHSNYVENNLKPNPAPKHYNYSNSHGPMESEKSGILMKMVHNHAQQNNMYKPAPQHPAPQFSQICTIPPMAQPVPPYNHRFNDMGNRPHMGYQPHYPMHHMPNIAPEYVPMREFNINNNPPQPFPQSNLASIYEGVAAKLGSGVIDDPLEAFNRIMKEKEKRKEERRRSPERRRSRSIEKQQRPRFRSPVYNHRSNRDGNSRERRIRIRLEPENDRRREPPPIHDKRRKREYSARRSCSPTEKRLRSNTYRSPTPPHMPYISKSPEQKSMYRHVEPRNDSFEPPPPGFETVTSVRNLQHGHDDKKFIRSTTPKKMFESRENERTNKYFKDKGKFEKVDKNTRSLTPPPMKPQIFKQSKQSTAQNADEKHVPHSADRDKHISKIDNQNSNENKKRPKSSDRERSHTSHEKNAVRNSLQILKTIDDDQGSESKSEKNAATKDLKKEKSKDRKKKKKEKTERKKSKKDKKDKREKGKRHHSPTGSDDHKDSNESAGENEHNAKDLVDGEGGGSGGATQKELQKIEVSKDKLIGQKSEIATPKKDILAGAANESVFRRIDSVLDIEGYDTDFDDNNQLAGKKNDLLKPQISRWECEDQNMLLVQHKDLTADSGVIAVDDHNAVTNEVLRKAENAIFARAINAIRPTEVKITIPSTVNADRSVAIKSDVGKKRSPSPKSSKSVKDRLGVKITTGKNFRPQHRENNERKKDRTTSKNYENVRSGNRGYHDKNKQQSYKSNDHFNDGEKHAGRKYDSRNRHNDFDLSSSSTNHGKNTFFGSAHKNRARTPPPRDRNFDIENRNLRFSLERKNSDDIREYEGRTISSVASKPVGRIENPFRTFCKTENVENKFIKVASTASSDYNSDQDDYKRKKKRHNKKAKKRSKLSSTESLDSEKRKSKKRSKTNKKKKKD